MLMENGLILLTQYSVLLRDASQVSDASLHIPCDGILLRDQVKYEPHAMTTNSKTIDLYLSAQTYIYLFICHQEHPFHPKTLICMGIGWASLAIEISSVIMQVTTSIQYNQTNSPGV